MTAGIPSMKDVRRISAVALWVSDLEGTAQFYRDVIGVPIGYSDPHAPKNIPHYETMWNGDGRLASELDWSKEWPAEPSLWFNIYQAKDKLTSGVELSFSVPDVDEVHERAAAAKVKIISPPRANNWGGREATYEDPDGNLVTVTS